MTATAEAPFRLAHLSDPHLTSLEGVRPGSLRDKRLLGWLSWRRKRRLHHRPEILARIVEDIRSTTPDQIAVTGDLTHIGLPGELEAARDWLVGLGDAERVTVIPGNHDLYVSDPARRMLKCWAPWMRGDAGDGDARFPNLRVRGEVALVSLSSSVATAPGLATGRLGTAQLQRLEAMLREQGDSGRYRLVLVHHGPAPGIDSWRKRLTDAPALAAALRRAGAELVLHGHGHRARVDSIDCGDRSIPVLGAPSASADDERPGRRAAWNLVCIHGRDDRWHTDVSVRDAQGRSLLEHHFSAPRPA